MLNIENLPWNIQYSTLNIQYSEKGFHKALHLPSRKLPIFAILIYRFSPILFYSPLINVREDLMSKAGNVSMHVDSLTDIF